ncbi:MAG: fused MFS/spermidine synthase [Bryobacteraceae bacterium]
MRARRLTLPFTIFVSAFLLFQVQPIVGRYVLPWFGGGPAVWTACLLFFQVALLAGYGYAHWLGSRSNARTQATVHAVLLAVSLVFLPIAPASVWKPVSPGDPVGRILLLLTATVGGPYVMLASTGPLLQRWFSLTRSGESPYRLYALSNVGSFLALLSYPFVVEPVLRLHTQVLVWTAVYVVFVALCVRCAWRFGSSRAAVSPEAAALACAPRPSPWIILFWLLLAACGSTLLMATTNQMCQEIAVIPFLWVVPLSIYLLTFILCFESERWYRRIVFAVLAGIMAPASCALVSAGLTVALWIHLAVYPVALFALCMLCHGELARSRPAAAHLTLFYLMVAAGGALGGVFVALAAPHLFETYLEYPIGLAAACLFGFLGWLRTGALRQWTRDNFRVRVPLMALLLGGITAVVTTVMTGQQPSLAAWRNFYGILRVSQKSDINGPFRQLLHGRIRHGFQYLVQGKRDWPTTYYGPHSGLGLVLNNYHPAHRRVGIIGLGTGTIAAWGQPGEVFRFYDINPDVQTIASGWFSFLKDSRAQIQVVLGDGRVQLERELAAGDPQDFDVLAVDAFSSDAIPIHLLTAECADVYRRHLKPDGALLLHISNKSLDLQPVARGMAEHLGWPAMFINTDDVKETGEYGSDWVLISRNQGLLDTDAIQDEETEWERPREKPMVWTDDFSSLWRVLK